MGDFNKVVELCNQLKYEDGSSVQVKLEEGITTYAPSIVSYKHITGFKFFQTDAGIDFEKKINKICKAAGFDDWIPSGPSSIMFF